VRFQGSKFTAEMAERDVFPDAALARYKTSAAAANREVARAGLLYQQRLARERAVSWHGTMDTMRTKLKDKQLGRLLIYGSSSGWRVAIDLAARLTTNNMSVHYLAVLDPAWYPDDTITEANLTGDLNVPVFSAPSIMALEKDNYYQTHGNESKPQFPWPDDSHQICSEKKFTEDYRIQESRFDRSDRPHLTPSSKIEATSTIGP